MKKNDGHSPCSAHMVAISSGTSFSNQSRSPYSKVFFKKYVIFPRLEQVADQNVGL
jgi:hypothetical protein